MAIVATYFLYYKPKKDAEMAEQMAALYNDETGVMSYPLLTACDAVKSSVSVISAILYFTNR